MLPKVPEGFKPIVTLYRLPSSTKSWLFLWGPTLGDLLPPVVTCWAFCNLLVVFCTSSLFAGLELMPKRDIMRRSSRSAISLSICMLRFSISILLTMDRASKFTAYSSSFLPWAAISSTWFLKAKSKSLLSRALYLWKLRMLSLMSRSTIRSSVTPFSYVLLISLSILAVSFWFSTTISFSNFLIYTLIT